MARHRDRRSIEKLLERVSERVVKRLQARSMQTLTSATPVDTGHARSRWQPSVTVPALEIPQERPKDEKQARREARRRRPANRAVSDRIAQTYKLRQGRVFITNPTSYIGFLNAGSSAQAPTNFVQRAIRAAVRSLGRSLGERRGDS